jgi:uncharacterized protein (DUF924 family)
MASAAAPDDPRLADLLDHWFSPAMQPYWFAATPDVDADLRQRFLDLHEAAAAGALDGWCASGRGCLGLILLLDQIPRNVFRGTARAFATDQQARAVTRAALARGLDAGRAPAERLFLYLPLEHSEDVDDQELAVRLIASLDGRPAWADYARRHRDVIARFGRFPQRNAALGRTSTADERRFLEDPEVHW